MTASKYLFDQKLSREFCKKKNELIRTKCTRIHNILSISNLQKHADFHENQSKVGLRGKESILSARFLSEKQTNG
jgi:hypothetical protein